MSLPMLLLWLLLLATIPWIRTHRRQSGNAAGKKNCPQCNRSVGPNTRRCPVPTCRHEFVSKKTTKRCPDCSRSINHTSRSCVYCRRAGIAGAKRVARGSKSCPTCGKSVGPNTRKCPDCPHVFPFPKKKTTKRCHNCQRSVNRNSRTCLYCRASLAPPGRLPPPINHVQNNAMMSNVGAVTAPSYGVQNPGLQNIPQQTQMIQHQTGVNGPPPLTSLQPAAQQLQMQEQQQQVGQMAMQMPEPVPRGPPTDTADEGWLALGNQSKQKEAAADHRIKA